MERRVHQLLLPIPAGLFTTAVLFDVARLFSSASWLSAWSYRNIALGLCAALLAAAFGGVEWTRLPRHTRARRMLALQGFGYGTAMLAFAAALVIRSADVVQLASPGVLALQMFGVLLIGITAWLGADLVDRMSVGAEERALRETHV